MALVNNHAVVDQSVEQEPDFFTGISLTIDQIDNDYRVELPSKLLRVVTAHRSKNATAMKLAAEDLAKFLGGMQSVADSVARAAVRHLKRRPRP